jgi:xanthine dehydrogenase small subunit
MGAFRFELDGGRILDARIAFGGMAAVPKRALQTEAAITGLLLSDHAQWRRVAGRLAADFQPIGDHRASAAYRMETAKALLVKALREIASQSTLTTRIVGTREKALGRVA